MYPMIRGDALSGGSAAAITRATCPPGILQKSSRRALCRRSWVGQSVAYVEGYLQQGRHVVSLDAPSRREGSSSLAQTLADTDQPDLEASLEEQDLQKQIHRSLMGLDVRHRIVLIRRFGMDGQEEETLSAVSKELGVSRERVRQLQEGALDLLRQHTELR